MQASAGKPITTFSALRGFSGQGRRLPDNANTPVYPVLVLTDEDYAAFSTALLGEGRRPDA
jgi:hypothetical protein